ncbi:hypothetical protein niasHS_017556 [Heterodera schachtii]|uniref:FLYWCH-type domain-containing protein n=1 Tax=Heterodera schachtii TaxID=97005 RepID=A0ABD2I0S1_HETSC
MNQQQQIKTKRNKVKLEHEGALYVFDQFSADGLKKFWRCEFHGPADKCKGRLHTDLHNVVQKVVGVHSCDMNAAHVECQRLVTGLKRRAAVTCEAPQLFRANTPQKKVIKRLRRDENAPRAEPLNLEQLEIPDAYRIYNRIETEEEQFLLADTGVFQIQGQNGPQRILIFGRASTAENTLQTQLPAQLHGVFNCQKAKGEKRKRKAQKSENAKLAKGEKRNLQHPCYTGRMRFNVPMSAPLFDPHEWSVYQRTLDRADRTNNFAEAFHRKLQRQFSCTHPTIWRFIDTIRCEQKAIDADMARCVMGEAAPQKKTKYRNADTRILRPVHRYNDINNNILPQNDHNYANVNALTRKRTPRENVPQPRENGHAKTYPSHAKTATRKRPRENGLTRKRPCENGHAKTSWPPFM